MPYVSIHRSLPKPTRDEEYRQTAPLDATPAIQAAIDNLQGIGGTIRFLDGTYLLRRSGATDHCLLVDKSKINLELGPGAVLKLADGEAGAGEALDMISVDHTGGVSGFTLSGPGTIDGNVANNPGVGGNLTLSNRGVEVGGTAPTDVQIGGGITFLNVAGLCIDVHGPSGTPAGDRTIIDGVLCRDSGEGIQCRHVNLVTVNNFQVFNMNKQDGLELISLKRFVVTNGIIQDCRDECLDVPSTSRACESGVISGLVLGPKITQDIAQAIVSFGGDGSSQPLRNIVFSDFYINMGNARLGIEINGVISGTTSTTKGIVIKDGIIDGALTSSLVNPAGIGVGGDAKRTLIMGVQINDCNNGGGSNAISLGGTFGGNPDDIEIIGCGGWNNVAGIVLGSGLQNTLHQNTFKADTP